jgi:hypothetical protein
MENATSDFAAELLPEIEATRYSPRMFDRSSTGGLWCACEVSVAMRIGAGCRRRVE